MEMKQREERAMGSELSKFYFDIMVRARFHKLLHNISKVVIAWMVALILINIAELKSHDLWYFGFLCMGFLFHQLMRSSLYLFEGVGNKLFFGVESIESLTVRNIESWSELSKVSKILVVKRGMEISSEEYEELEMLIGREGLADARRFIENQLKVSHKVTYFDLAKVLIYSEGKRKALEQEESGFRKEAGKIKLLRTVEKND